MENSEKIVENGAVRKDSHGHLSDQKDEVIPLVVPPRLRKLHDREVSFQEYQHYAKITREEQDRLPKPKIGKNWLAYLVPNMQKQETGAMEFAAEHRPQLNTSDRENRKLISDEEWLNASRALRTAGTGAIFYLITTDIFGPFGLPYAFATTGWG